MCQTVHLPRLRRYLHTVSYTHLTSGLVAFILLSMITCGIYAWYWYYKLGNRLANNCLLYTSPSDKYVSDTVIPALVYRVLCCVALCTLLELYVTLQTSELKNCLTKIKSLSSLTWVVQQLKLNLIVLSWLVKRFVNCLLYTSRCV